MYTDAASYSVFTTLDAANSYFAMVAMLAPWLVILISMLFILGSLKLALGISDDRPTQILQESNKTAVVATVEDIQLLKDSWASQKAGLADALKHSKLAIMIKKMW